MKVCHCPYLIFYISRKFDKKEMIMRIWISAIFVLSCFVVIKIAVSAETFCSCNDNFKVLGN